MAKEEIFLITQEGRSPCPRFISSCHIKFLYERDSQTIVKMGPEEKEIGFAIGDKGGIELMEKIINDPEYYLARGITTTKITSPDTQSSLKRIIDNFKKIPENPSLELALRGSIIQQFELIISRG